MICTPEYPPFVVLRKRKGKVWEGKMRVCTRERKEREGREDESLYKGEEGNGREGKMRDYKGEEGKGGK